MLNTSNINSLTVHSDISFDDILDFTSLEEFQEFTAPPVNPNFHIHALWWLGTYSSIVAYRVGQMISDAQDDFKSRKTTNDKESFIQPQVIFRDTNIQTINQKFNASSVGVIPIANTFWNIVRQLMWALLNQEKQGRELHVLWFTALDIHHRLACKAGTRNIKKKSIHTHPQAHDQCIKSLIQKWCVETIEVKEGKKHLEAWEAMICKAKDWKDYQDKWYLVLHRSFQDEERKQDKYTIFTCESWKDVKIRKVFWTTEAIEQCRGNIISVFDTIKRIPEDSTNSHIPHLQDDQAVICSRESAILSGLEFIDDGLFGPEENETLFMVLWEWDNVRNTPWLIKWLSHNRKILIFPYGDKKTRQDVTRILDKEGIRLDFSRKEAYRPGIKVFSWITKSHIPPHIKKKISQDTNVKITVM